MVKLTLSKKNLRCGLGNRLFNYNFLMQIAHKTLIDPIIPTAIDQHYFKSNYITYRNLNFLTIFSKKVEQIDFAKLTPRERIEKIISLSKLTNEITFSGNFLGSYFFDHLYIDPKQIFQLPALESVFFVRHPYAALHFRGKDFHDWDQNAVLNYRYYIHSIEKCLNLGIDSFRLVTDDLTLDSLKTIKSYLEQRKISFEIINNDERVDFSILARADIVVISPSTFCIWATILGKSRRLILPEDWLDYSITRNDKFWIDLVNKKQDLLKIEAIL